MTGKSLENSDFVKTSVDLQLEDFTIGILFLGRVII